MQSNPTQSGGNFRRAQSDAAPRGDRQTRIPGLGIFNAARRLLLGAIRPRSRRGPGRAGSDAGPRSK